MDSISAVGPGMMMVKPCDTCDIFSVQASSAPAAEEERNETEEVQAEGRQRQTHETIQDVMMRLRSKAMRN